MVIHLHSWVQAAYYIRHNKWVSQLSKNCFERKRMGMVMPEDMDLEK